MMKVVLLMNKRQLEVQKANAAEEQKVIRQLKQVYNQAKKDCEAKIAELNSRTDMQNLQAIVYQKQYQEALKKQIEGILDTLQSNQFNTITEYLGTSYENGFLGALYDLQGQGIPLIIPIDQSQVVQALQTDSKISTNMYTRLGEDVTYLKKSIKAELSRGTANGSSWLEIATKIATGMNSPFNKALNNSLRIARTEGHRIQQQAQWNTLQTAKEKGADVVKQWDSTLDDRTRSDHKILDGQIRELDDYFEVGGYKAMYPGSFGVASEDIHCRCCMLQRAKWALDEDELHTLEERAAYFGLDKSGNFQEFKDKYLKLPQNADTMELTDNETVKQFKEIFKKLGVEYRQVSAHDTPLTESEIIEALAGGDKTSGSCASVALAYVGQKSGLDVLDFRGGESQNFFSTNYNLKKISELPNITRISETARATATAGKKLLGKVEEGKEYYFVCGRHASIVRKENGTLQYLELQSATQSGWTNFNGNVRYTLTNRFGATQTGWDYEAYMFDVSDAKGSKELQEILGYINTAEDKQKKGVGGSVK
jgi:hypothetical protein